MSAPAPKPGPRIPDDRRLVELANLQPKGWYLDHLSTLTVGQICGCNLDDPDRDCDKGQALYRLMCKEIAPRKPA